MCSEDQNFNFAVNYWLYETENCRIALVCCREKYPLRQSGYGNPKNNIIPLKVTRAQGRMQGGFLGLTPPLEFAMLQ